MSLPLYDTIFMGNVHERPRRCGICQETVCGVYLTHVELPEGIAYRSTILAAMVGNASKFLGIGCGCYGKVHRQIAHMKDARDAEANYQEGIAEANRRYLR